MVVNRGVNEKNGRGESGESGEGWLKRKERVVAEEKM